MKIFKSIIKSLGILGLLVFLGYSFYFLQDDGFDPWLIVVISFYLINSIFILGLFSQKRNPTTKISWIVVMAILPLFGHFTFLVFGRRYPKAIPQKENILKKQYKFENLENNPVSNENQKNLFERQMKISNRGVYSANYKFFDNGIDAYKNMFDEMKKAKKFIHIHFYIIHPGEIYDEFKSILIEKIKQGVKIRLIVDDFGRWAMPWYEIKKLEQQGIEVAIFGKVTFPFIGSENGYRTHKKCIIIDGKKVFAGGMNIGDEYANLSKKYGEWVDCQFVLTGAATKSYSLLFINDWEMITKIKLDYNEFLVESNTGNSQSILVDDGPNVKDSILSRSFISWIHNAKKSIKISTPYLVPTEGILLALITAVNSGVKVTIYIPGRTDKSSVYVATRYWAKELTEHGIEIREMNNMMLHSKIGIFDDEYAYVGTANLDARSLYSQFEFVNLLTGNAIKGINNIFDKYKNMSTLLTKDDLKIAKIRYRIIRIYVNAFTPLM